jgi:hypothetical protein
MAGSVARGKLIFLSRFPWSTNTLTQRCKISVNMFQVSTPAQRKIP